MKPDIDLLAEAIDLMDVQAVDDILSKDPRIVHKADYYGRAVLQIGKVPMDVPKRVSIAKLLANAGAPTDVRDEHGRYLLHRAIQSRNLESARFLLENGADLNATDSFGQTALHIATQYYEREITFLLKFHPNLEVVDFEGRSPLLMAAKCGYPEKIRLLAAAGADVRCLMNLSASEALECGENSHVERMVQRRPDLPKETDKTGRTLLHIAAREKNLRIADLLISRGADVNASDNDGMTPLHEAVREERPYYRRYLVEQSLLASTNLLAKAGANLDVVDKLGRTPLHVALDMTNDGINGKQLTVECLLAAGANPNISDNGGRTPLRIALDYEDMDSRAAEWNFMKYGPEMWWVTNTILSRTVKKYGGTL